MKQPTVLIKRVNQVQATQAEDESETVVEGKTVTKDVEEEEGASTAHYTRHQFETSREK